MPTRASPAPVFASRLGTEARDQLRGRGGPVFGYLRSTACRWLHRIERDWLGTLENGPSAPGRCRRPGPSTSWQPSGPSASPIRAGRGQARLAAPGAGLADVELDGRRILKRRSGPGPSALTATPSSWPRSKPPARPATSGCSSCRPARPSCTTRSSGNRTDNEAFYEVNHRRARTRSLPDRAAGPGDVVQHDPTHQALGYLTPAEQRVLQLD